MPLNRRERFDSTRDFVVKKPFQIFGKRVVPGQPFDKLLLSERRLRQLYDQYMVEHAPVSAIPAAGLSMTPVAPVEIPKVVTEAIAEPVTADPTEQPAPEVSLTRSERVRAAKRLNRQEAATQE